MKKFLLRKIDFGFNDEQLFQMGEGYFNLAAQFDTRTAAEEAYWNLEKEALQGKGLGFYQFFTNLFYQNEALFLQINEYLKEQFDLDLLITYGDSENLYVSRDAKLPDTLSIEEVKEILKLTKFQQYQIVELKEVENNFHGIYFTGNYNQKKGWRQNNVYARYSSTVPAVYESEWNAKEFIKKESIYSVGAYLRENPINIALEELSDTPDLLKNFILQAEGISFNDEKEICFEYINGESLLTFNALLKDPIFIIKPIPKDLVETCQYTEPEM